jgi:predicted nucleic acid-binding protein
MYLLDTNVVSELRRPRPHPAVLAWLQATDDATLHLSAVTIAEIQSSIERVRDHDAGKANELEEWLDMVSATYSVLPMDAAAFRRWARLMHRRSDTLYEDAMIAATALCHGFTIVTRNVRDFVLFDVPVVDPFAYGKSAI